MRPPNEQLDIVGQATTAARKDGVFAGVTSGFVGALIGSKMGFGRNKTIFCGILTGVLSGYMFTQAFFQTRLAVLQSEQAAQRKTPPPGDPTLPSTSQSPN